MHRARRLGRATPALAVCVVLAAAGVVAEEPATILFDFDGGSLSENWSAVREITARREPLPAVKFEQQLQPRGQGVSITTKGNAGLFAKSGCIPPDWRRFETLSFWVYRSDEEAKTTPKSTVEVQIYEPDGRSRFWRKIEIAKSGWNRISVPLRWFRWSPGRIPRWDRADRLGFWFRDPAQLSIDTVWLAPVKIERETYGTEVAADELIEIAFPNAAERVRVVEEDHVSLFSNAADLNTERLVHHLGQVYAAIYKSFPFFPKQARPPTLLVFEDRASYQDFFPRLASQFESVAPKPTSDGFTMLTYAGSYWDANQGTLRPVFTHEYVHGLLARALHLASKGDWVHEGLAASFQSQFHPQDNIEQIIEKGISREEFQSPLQQLTDGRRIPTNRYWQAMTLLEMLRSNPKYAKAMPQLFDAFRAAGSTKLAPYVGPLLKTDWASLTEDWKTFCRQTYIGK